MTPLAAIDTLLRDPRVWRGNSAAPDVPIAASGHAQLDAALPHHGWVMGTLNEILFDADGIGELELVLPVLATLTRQRRHVVAVSTPYVAYAPALRAHDLDLEYLHCIDVKSDVEALWASEQCLRSGICAAVLCWPRQAHERTLRRLQVAAESGHALGFAFRPVRAAMNPSPASMRIQLHVDHGTRLSVLKCRGGLVPARPLVLRAAIGGGTAPSPAFIALADRREKTMSRSAGPARE